MTHLKQPTTGNLLLLLIFLALLLTSSWRIMQRFDLETLIIPADARLPTGSQYFGEVVDGLFEGEGKLLSPNGDRYVGQFKQGQLAGQGELEYSNGDIYKGEFHAGMYHGQGRLQRANGEVYEGEFRDNNIEGIGRYAFHDGNIYQGEFHNGLPDGSGKFILKNGDTYEGQVSKGQPNGLGTYHRNQHIYHGQFSDGQFAGKGEYEDRRGNHYSGEFVNWQFDGQGTYTTAKGDIYSGEFIAGALTGEGEYQAKNGDTYRGEFVDWRPEGVGVKTTKNEIYRGEFEYGYYHGTGQQTNLETQQVLEGEWRYGNFVGTDEQELAEPSADEVLYNQNQLLEQSWQQLAPQNPELIDLYVLAVAGDGKQHVFKKEVDFVSDTLNRYYATHEHLLKLINNTDTITDTPLASTISIARSLNHIATQMNIEQDILLLYLTSHGAEDPYVVLDQPGLSLRNLNDSELQTALAATNIQWKIVMISACYSGGFIPALADDNSLIITAAAKDRVSFGCGDDSELTYFAKAYFKEALTADTDFEQAFARAQELVLEWETRDQVENYSNPQIHMGKNIKTHLAKWRAQLQNTAATNKLSSKTH